MVIQITLTLEHYGVGIFFVHLEQSKRVRFVVHIVLSRLLISYKLSEGAPCIFFLPRFGCHHWGARPPLRKG